MQAYNASYSRKLNRGRPNRFRNSEESYITIKKQELFDKHEAHKEIMSLINLTYQFGKISKEEYDIACFLEQLAKKAQKSLGAKTLPSSSPNTWNVSIQSSWNNINSSFENTKAESAWKCVKDFVSAHNPSIYNEFFKIISSHYSYEELQAIKTGTFNITNVLKEGLQIVKKMFALGYL